MRLSHSSTLLALALVAPGCTADLIPEGSGETDGIHLGGTGSETGDPDPTIDPSAGPGSETGEPDPSDGESSSGEPACAGEENACGGCDALPQTIGDPCNGCEDLTWECDGENAVVCSGYDPTAAEYYPDEDGDGFGDASHDGLVTCEDPGEGWVFDNSDCDDDNDEVHPDATEVCNGIDDDCDDNVDEGPTEFCDDVCCSFELSCDGTACVPKCDEGEICGADLDMCCGAGEVCFANDCVTPGADCEFTEECPVGEVCAQATGQCVPEKVVPVCEFVPPVGEFDPVVGCQSSVEGLTNTHRDDVVATPIVINLTDDDTPDVVFLTYDPERRRLLQYGGDDPHL